MSSKAGEDVIDPQPEPVGTTGTGAKRGWYTVILLSAVVMLAHVDRGVIALMVQPIKRDFHLTDTQVSILLGFAFTFPYVLVGLPMSRVADRSVRKYLVAGSLAVWSVATAVSGLTQSFWGLFFARSVIGGSESVNTPATISIIADAVPRDKLPRAYAIYHGGFTAGAAMALAIGGILIGLLADIQPIPVPGIGRIYNWQLVFMIVGIPGLVLAAVVLITVPEPVRRGGTRPGGYRLREVWNSILAQRSLHFHLLPGMVLLGIMTQAIAAWTPAFYERTYGWGPATAGPLLGGVSLVSSALGLVLGAKVCEFLARRHDDANLRALFLAQALALPLTVMGPLMPNPWLALGCLGLGSVFGVIGGPAFVSALQVTTPNEMRGQINVLYATLVNVIAGSLGPTMTGLLTDFVAPTEGDLRYVLVAIKLLVGPPALYLIWKAIAPYGRVFRQGLSESA